MTGTAAGAAAVAGAAALAGLLGLAGPAPGSARQVGPPAPAPGPGHVPPLDRAGWALASVLRLPATISGREAPGSSGGARPRGGRGGAGRRPGGAGRGVGPHPAPARQAGAGPPARVRGSLPDAGRPPAALHHRRHRAPAGPPAGRRARHRPRRAARSPPPTRQAAGRPPASGRPRRRPRPLGERAARAGPRARRPPPLRRAARSRPRAPRPRAAARPPPRRRGRGPAGAVRLLAPLVTCVLPAFALLTVVPLLVASLRRLPPDRRPRPTLAPGPDRPLPIGGSPCSGPSCPSRCSPLHGDRPPPLPRRLDDRRPVHRRVRPRAARRRRRRAAPDRLGHQDRQDHRLLNAVLDQVLAKVSDLAAADRLPGRARARPRSSWPSCCPLVLLLLLAVLQVGLLARDVVLVTHAAREAARAAAVDPTRERRPRRRPRAGGLDAGPHGGRASAERGEPGAGCGSTSPTGPRPTCRSSAPCSATAPSRRRPRCGSRPTGAVRPLSVLEPVADRHSCDNEAELWREPHGSWEDLGAVTANGATQAQRSAAHRIRGRP